jgi:hypothetical protein
LEAGGVALKCDSSGIAHSCSRWIELGETCKGGISITANLEASASASDFWSSLFQAYVQLPIDSSKEYYSCGMHLLGGPDVIISKALLQSALPKDASLVNAVVDLFSSFCIYILDECPHGQFLSGNTFQPTLDFPSFRVVWESCERDSEHDLYFNPYGRWRFASLGKNTGRVKR